MELMELTAKSAFSSCACAPRLPRFANQRRQFYPQTTCGLFDREGALSFNMLTGPNPPLHPASAAPA